MSLRAHSVSLHVVTGRGGQDSEAEGREQCGSPPLWANLRHRSFRSGQLPNFMIQLRFTRQLAFCSVLVSCGFRKLVSLDSIEEKTCLLPRITNNMIISIVLIYKYYCGMPFYENKYNNLMFLIELLKLCFSYYEQFQIFGLCQFILFKLLWDILYWVTVGLWKRKQGKHAIF